MTAVERIPLAIVEVPITGLTPLIMRNWRRVFSASPEDQYEASIYRLRDGGIGFPSAAFKAAISDTARYFEGITTTTLKAATFVRGEPDADDDRWLLVPIKGTPKKRTEITRGTGGVGPDRIVDVRHNAEVWPWSAVLGVQYNSAILTEEAVVALVDAAGCNGVGVGRPAAPGNAVSCFGQWRAA